MGYRALKNLDHNRAKITDVLDIDLDLVLLARRGLADQLLNRSITGGYCTRKTANGAK